MLQAVHIEHFYFDCTDILRTKIHIIKDQTSDMDILKRQIWSDLQDTTQ